ncbi:MAG: general stress protein CsbD [Sphingobacteriales bacterium]|nr:MAG: general stress protein CsbD [Sphingobacteriales bacterium]
MSDLTKGNSNAYDAHWNITRGKLKTKYPMLSSKDLYFKHGHKDAMMDALQEKLGITRKELDDIITAL